MRFKPLPVFVYQRNQRHRHIAQSGNKVHNVIKIFFRQRIQNVVRMQRRQAAIFFGLDAAGMKRVAHERLSNTKASRKDAPKGHCSLLWQ